MTARRLGVTQPRLNDLRRGRLDKLSLDALVLLVTDGEIGAGARKAQISSRTPR